MFWSNWNEQRASIMRATLSGKNMRIIVSADILTPNGLTIDHKAEKLYFSDRSLGKIERCDFDGSGRYVSLNTREWTILCDVSQTSAGLMDGWMDAVDAMSKLACLVPPSAHPI